MLKKFVLLFAISCFESCFAYEFNKNTTEDFNGSSELSMIERKTRANLVSFQPLGEHINLGLDFLLPFIKVPIVKQIDAYGNEPALININTAALVSTGLLATSSALVSFIFRKYVVLREAKEEASSEKRRRSDNILEHELRSMLNNFKLVYTNSSGGRVDTSLAGLLENINETFEKNGIDLSSCIQKAICARIQLSARRANEGDSSGVDKIIYGLTGIKLLKTFLSQTSFKDAIDSKFFLSKQHKNNYVYCDIKYPQCKWSMPEDNLTDIIRTYLKFT